MPTFSRTLVVPQSLDASFAFIEDPTNLPYYFPRITAAELVEPGLVRTTAVIDEDGDGDNDGEPVTADAWFTVDAPAHAIAWGSPDNDAYSGSLTAVTSGDSTELQLEITTSASYPGIEESLDEALASIAAKLSEIAT
jgi:hypothetical protein